MNRLRIAVIIFVVGATCYLYLATPHIYSMYIATLPKGYTEVNPPLNTKWFFQREVVVLTIAGVAWFLIPKDKVQ